MTDIPPALLAAAQETQERYGQHLNNWVALAWQSLRSGNEEGIVGASIGNQVRDLIPEAVRENYFGYMFGAACVRLAQGLTEPPQTTDDQIVATG